MHCADRNVLEIKLGQAFIMESCRLQAPIASFVSDNSTCWAGSLDLANLDAAVFPDPLKFDPGRANLRDALTWNGRTYPEAPPESKKTSPARRNQYPRLCPGRQLSLHVVKILVEVTLEA